MEAWEVIIICLLAFFICIAILMLTDVQDKIRRKKYPVWYEHYNRALSNSLTIGSKFREKTENINMRTKAIYDMFFNDECSIEEYTEAMKILNEEYSQAAKWFKINQEALGIEEDLKAADAYAKEHNLKWGIIYE